jgi:hypothetical protein
MPSLSSWNIHFHVGHALSLHFRKGFDSSMNIDQRRSCLIRESVKGRLALFFANDYLSAIRWNISQSFRHRQQLVGSNITTIAVFQQFVDNRLGLYQRRRIDGVLEFQRNVLGSDAI